MDVKNCAISGRGEKTQFVATVLDRSKKPVANFSLKAATTGRIVIGNGDNIADYDVLHRIGPNVWTDVSVKNPYGVRSFSDCTVSFVRFTDGTFWSMPTPEF